MDLRICFENRSKGAVRVDDASMFRHYATNYLADFNPEWGGFIACDAAEMKENHLEPLWQVLIRNASAAIEAELLAYIERNPMVAYHVHVYRKATNQNAVKIH